MKQVVALLEYIYSRIHQPWEAGAQWIAVPIISSTAQLPLSTLESDVQGMKKQRLQKMRGTRDNIHKKHTAAAVH